ncbi:hypothetical protein HYS49_03375, partial [Candidatus Woesearchaeota archaeon]|nr:hypothetical protein [Candidatus Woesearchaeota archaeon]
FVLFHFFMRHAWKKYLDSFSNLPLVGKTFLIDAAAFALLFALFSAFSAYLQKKSSSLAGAQQAMLSQNPEALLPYLMDIKQFLLVFIVGGILLLLVTLALVSFSRAYIWSTLIKKHLQKKMPWRWIGLSLALIIPSLLLGAFLLLLELLGARLFQSLLSLNASWYVASQQAVSIIGSFLNSGLNFLLLLIFLAFLFSAALTFVQKERAWASIGEAFSLLKKNIRQLPVFLLFALGTALLLSLLSRLFSSAQYLYPTAWMIATAAVSLLYLSWLRLYFLETMHGEA